MPSAPISTRRCWRRRNWPTPAPAGRISGLLEVKSGNLRAVVEVKAPEEDTPATADGTQVARYWQRYGCVLVTNYRDFLLVVRQPEGKARVEGRYQLAPSAEAFWRAKPRTLAKQHAEAFTDFLVGVLTRAHDITALAPLQGTMEETLGLHLTANECRNSSVRRSCKALLRVFLRLGCPFGSQGFFLIAELNQRVPHGFDRPLIFLIAENF
jgi:hypothetical protein